MRLAIFGLGSIGRSVCKSAIATGASVYAVADSSAVVFSRGNQFSEEDLDRIIGAKSSGSLLRNIAFNNNSQFQVGTVSDYFDVIESDETLKSNLILADCSSFGDANQYLLPSQQIGIPVALANKVPLSSDFSTFNQLTSTPSLIRHEATVGAGLPVVNTLRRLANSGDKISMIEGCFSGTLGYIFSALQNTNQTFSEIVMEAHAQGLTEPDPRDDLSGTDVARKVLILARMLGYQMELEDIDVQPLFSKEMSKMSLEDFLTNLHQLDSTFIEMKKGLADENEPKVMKYLATLSFIDGRKPTAKVGIKLVEESSEFGQLQGTDNCIVFETSSYSQNKLVVKGPGAGVSVTAEGVLADCYDLFQR